MVRLRQLVSIDDSQFGFVPGRGTTDAIFVKKAPAREVSIWLFVDLETAFDGVPQKLGGRRETLVWRSGLCDWCRVGIPTSRAMVRDTVKS